MLIRLDDERHGAVTLDGMLLPGILQSVSINGAIIYEKGSAEPSQAKRKVLSGYDDKTIQINILFMSDLDDESGDLDEIYQQVEKLESYFMQTRDKLPVIYQLNHPHIQARNIDKCLFKSFGSTWSTGSKKITATLEFVEFVPAKYEVASKEEAEIQDANERQKKEQSLFEEGRLQAHKDLGVK